MKPKTLIIQAFGPFSSRISLDFSNVCNTGTIFLIAGPTGSGKTTILDAICFALYGDTSGMERSGKEMRSDRCASDKITEVIYEFQLRGETYRIRRAPEQLKPKIRGEGFTAAAPEATLYKVREGEAIPLAERWSSVNAEVEKLFGMGSSQFRQVVILPQGQFRKLLLAGSSEREEILKTLFRTEYYTLIEKKLKDKAKELHNEMQQLDAERRGILESSGAESAEDLTAGLEKSIQDKKKLEKNLRAAIEQEKITRDNLKEAEELSKKFSELRELQIELDKLSEKKKEIDETKFWLEQGRKALSLKDSEDSLVETEKTEKNRNDALLEWESKTKTALQEKEKAEEALRQLEKQKKEIQEIRIKANHLKTLEPILNKLHQQREELYKTNEAKELNLKDLQKKEKLRNEYRGKKKQNSTMIEDLRTKTRDHGKLTYHYQEAVKHHTVEAELLELEQEKKTYTADLEQLSFRKEQCRRESENLQTKINLLLKEWKNNQASSLAKELKPGKACPVCGSISHPDPAAISSTPLETSEIEQFQERQRELQETLRGINEDETELHKKIAAVDSKHATHSENLAGSPLTDEMRDPREIKKMLSETEKAAGDLEKLTAENKEIDETIERLDLNINKGTGEYKSLETRVENLKQSIAEKEEQLPEGVTTPEELGDQIQSLEKRASNFEEELEAVSRRKTETAEYYASAVASLKAAQKEYRESKKNKEEKESLFLSKLKKQGFQNRDEYEKYQLPEEKLNHLEEEIDSFEHTYRITLDTCKKKEAETADVSEPNLNKHQKALEEIVTERQRIEKSITLLESQIASRGKNIERLEKKKKDLEALELTYNDIGTLADTAAGKNKLRITFHRFVLTALFDDILLAASHRLGRMSKGRFHLQRNLQADDLRSHSGLDIAVHDSYTGTLRSAGTLSGGESFLAALSLALGMADVVQKYSGGIHLDTIFVDEGFGSLDPEALDSAMASMIELKSSGRIIGIISHVSELRERIETQLLVSAGRDGSSAGFVSPHFFQTSE
jgi:DNA repair protein SbcC/Rad50